jgi:hypothetical protein
MRMNSYVGNRNFEALFAKASVYFLEPKMSETVSVT